MFDSCLGFPSRSNSSASEPWSALPAPYSRYPDSLSLRPSGNPLPRGEGNFNVYFGVACGYCRLGKADQLLVTI